MSSAAGSAHTEKCVSSLLLDKTDDERKERLLPDPVKKPSLRSARLRTAVGEFAETGGEHDMIYLDHNATTPVLSAVFEEMRPYFCVDWGNPSSTYRFGSKIKSAVETARERVAELLGALSREIIFTSCGTESNNTAIHAALQSVPAKKQIITSAVEHSAVLAYCRALERDGYQVTYLPVDREGLLTLADLEAAITPDTAVVSLMWANNETGVLFPIEKIGNLCRARNVLFHCDGAQAVGKMTVEIGNMPVDYLSVTGHKFNHRKV